MTSGADQEAARTAVLMWCQPDGLWRWRWVRFGQDGTEDTSLPSHQAYLGQDEARQKAAEAYPGLPIHLVGPERRGGGRRHRVRRLLCLALVAVLVVQALRGRAARQD